MDVSASIRATPELGLAGAAPRKGSLPARFASARPASLAVSAKWGMSGIVRACTRNCRQNKLQEGTPAGAESQLKCTLESDDICILFPSAASN
ncbi:hypothetical protein GUJ93_ZPchr0003g17788 [Zizania palustris]|uniref:Uncharacterized protein n=1 Tax=Zizania palustris TaxID=103762 RepID=A0A8J5VWN5_ZIZPA|nr:hypothetical protein GUJ93_ZPchr0003g17788 [Zizania palustris]